MPESLPSQAQRILSLPPDAIRSEEPDLWLMLEAMYPDWPDDGTPLSALLNQLDSTALREQGLSAELVRESIGDFYRHFSSDADECGIATLTVCGGRGKNGAPEPDTLELCRGEVVCLVGPTGAGKSRLLSDLECLAQGDTPTGRRVLLDGVAPDEQTRFSIERKIVAQLTQNMNFVMDVPVGEFLELHARSRLKPDPAALAAAVLEQANALAGESFSNDTPLTSLSGGQSRALMIADTALICDSPVVLIDEIENAGVDRRRALELLVSRRKIVVLATHDPVLALLSDRRVIIRDGAIARICVTTDAERGILDDLLHHDERLSRIRSSLRLGQPLALDSGE